LYDFAKQNGFIVNEQQMVDEGGHQLAHIEYPGLPREEVLDAVHHFYDEYYFRPKAIFRIVKKAFFDNHERRRLYKEAKSFLALRAQRKRYVEERRRLAIPPTPKIGGAAPSGESTEPANAELANA